MSRIVRPPSMMTPGRSAQFFALLLLFASSSRAIDLSRFGKKNNDDPAAVSAVEPAGITTEDALDHAKRLVNDLNDASTGTVTNYKGFTCNEIMARSVVVANEEKAAMVAEKDAIVRAASLLAEKNEELTSQFAAAKEEIAALKQVMENAKTEHEAELKETASAAEIDLKEIEQTLSDEKADHEMKLKEVMEDAERVKEAAEQNILAERERSKINLDTVKNATSATIAKVEKETADKLAAKDVEVADKVTEMQLQIAQIEEETAEKIAGKDVEVAEKLAEAELQIKKIHAETQRKIEASQKGADDMVASMTAKADRDRTNLLESTQKQIDEAKAEAQRKVSQMESQMSERELEHRGETSELKAAHANNVKEMRESAENRIQDVRNQMEKATAKADDKLSAEREKHAGIVQGMEDATAELKAAHADKVKEMEEATENRVREVQGQMESVIAEADDKLFAEQEKHTGIVREMKDAREKMAQDLLDELEKEMAKADARLSAEQERYNLLEKELQKLKAETQNKERRLRDDIHLLRSNSFKLEKEVSSWKENFESRGYCNTTLIKEDSKRLIASAWYSASRELEDKGSDVMLLIETEIMPKLLRIAGEVNSKAVALYHAHLAEIVDQNIVPMYNQHILPGYLEHVSPAVKTIKGEAAVVIEKLSKEARKARSGAGKLVRQSSSSALGAMKEREIDSMLPVSLMTLLVRSSMDGEWAVDRLFKGLLVVFAILCRALILRMIWGMFTLVWFFCPLRLFVGGRPEKNCVENKGARDTATQVVKSENGVFRTSQ